MSILPVAAALFIALSIAHIFLPIRAYYRRKLAHQLSREYRNIQLRTVRKYYPELEKLTYREIVDQYDVSASYHNILRQKPQNFLH